MDMGIRRNSLNESCLRSGEEQRHAECNSRETMAKGAKVARLSKGASLEDSNIAQKLPIFCQ